MTGASAKTDAGTHAPICVLGMPRSGTTWLGKIFDSHPDTLYRHEPDSGPLLRDVPIAVSPDEADPNADRMLAFLRSLSSLRSVRVSGKLPLFRKRHLPGWRGAAHRGSAYLAKAVSRFANLPIIEPIDTRRAQPRPVWKSIESAGRAGLIATSCPDARIVLIVRHPCGQIDSTLRGEAAGSFTADCLSANDWGIFEQLLETPQARRRDLTMARLRELTPVERLAWRWLLFNEKAMEELDGRPGARVLRYEDLCERPEETARDVLEFTGLDWDEAVATFLSDSASTDDPSYYSIHRNPAVAANGWRKRLSEDVVARIRGVVEDSRPGQLFTHWDLDT